MRYEARVLGGVFFSVVLALTQLAGCPRTEGLSPTLADLGADDSTGQPAPASTLGSVNSGTVDDGELAADFPGCRPATLEDAWRDEIFRLVNEARAAEGLGAVRQNDTLEAQATQYACEMISYNFFDHVNPVTKSTLATRAEEFGYQYVIIGENLAAGQTTPRQAFDDWMASPTHRENIMDARFTELGVGIRMGGEYGLYWVQEFGRPLSKPRP